MIAYKFVKWDISPLEKYKDTEEYILAEKLEKGENLTRKEKNRITEMAKEYGHIRLRGWLYPLKNLKTFYVEQYGNVYKVRGYDKTAIRKTTYGKIDKIVERI